MKLKKPSKQAVLKGLLLLVVGLNFSWRPLISELHETTMASDADPKVTVIGAGKAGDTTNPFSKFDLICGRYMSLQLLPDGTHAKRVFKDNDNKIIQCEECDKEIYKIKDAGLLKTDPNSMVDEVVSQLMPLGCDAMMSEKEKAAKLAKEKELEEAKHKLAQDQVNCLSDKNGKDLNDEQTLNCQMRNMNLSDAKMKEAGIDKEEANRIRKDLAKDALTSIAKTCKKNHKEDQDFDECDDLMKRYSADIRLLASHTKDKGVKAEVETLSKKFDKLDTFVDKEKKAVEVVEKYTAKYEALNTQMDKAHDALSKRCDVYTTQAAARGLDFDTEACVTAEVKKYMLPYFEPRVRQLTTAFAAEERKFKNDFQTLGKVDIVGTEGATSGLAPFKEYQKTLVNYGATNFITAKDLPHFDGDAATAAAAADIANWSAADIQLRTLGTGGLRPFTMPAQATAVNGVAPANVFAKPVGITNGIPASVYNHQLPVLNRAQPVTAGLVTPAITNTQAELMMRLQ